MHQAHHYGPALTAAIARLREQLGPDALTVLEPWDGDPRTVALAAPHNPRALAYLSVAEGQSDRFTLSLRFASESDDFAPEEIAVFPALDLPALVDLIRDHLR
jgi:hypothetical protein